MKLVTKTLTLITLLLLTSCATGYQPREVKPRRVVKPKSYQELRQQKILGCTKEFLQQGVDFEAAVRGCKEDIYYK